MFGRISQVFGMNTIGLFTINKIIKKNQYKNIGGKDTTDFPCG